MLQKWIDVLVAHKVIKKPAVDFSEMVSMELPLAGALSQEGVANRTLLIGPAGGFYTACAEDIYPNCWSAVCAADVAKKAITQRHVQDALQMYRHEWGATLGDYLRGPQENLKFLLPLVYRNSVMTARLAEAILFGKSVVR
jgi:flavin-dependent dehydrogenase